MLAINLIVLTAATVASALFNEDSIFWGYECHKDTCTKVKLSDYPFATNLLHCRLYCGGRLGTIWPIPTGVIKFEPYSLRIKNSVDFNIQSNLTDEQLWEVNRRRFRSQLDAKIREPNVIKTGGRLLTIKIVITQAREVKPPALRYDTDESYSLKITNFRTNVVAEIGAPSFFGARHGLETISQLIIYDDVLQGYYILGQAEITDEPAYNHRGVLLDTGRNYFSVKSIKRTIDTMAMTKLNTFHWHISDATSFPLVVKSQPDFHRYAAYSPHKIYTHDDIIDLVEFARARGVRIYTGLDLPAHAGKGWQLKNLTVCSNIQPWKDYCPFPPCGQLDPTNEQVYPILEDIYREIFDIFDLDILHMGGSQVILKCWREEQHIRDWVKKQGWSLENSDLMKLWVHFQAKALAVVDKVSNDSNVPIVLWHNDYLDKYIDSKRYIIQTTTRKGFLSALKHGYRTILSNSDALFLDCGFANPHGFGNNWCSPYKGWQKIYENRPGEIAGEYKHLVLGAEATNWSEQLDEHTLDSRFWPRASALAERLWSDPVESWRAAEARMLIHRERLVENGIRAETLQPEWCLQNENMCPKGS